MKVYLQKATGVSDSSYYKYLKNWAPAGVEYVGGGQFGIITKSGGFKRNFWLKMFVKKLLRIFNISMPNAYFTKNADKYDLIHCAHCLSKNTKLWVMDIEHSGQFWWGSYSKGRKKLIDGKIVKIFDVTHKNKVRKYLNSKYCKKIMPWSEWTKGNILREFPELKNKIEIVYPAIPLRKIKKKKKDGKMRILFIGRDFEMKGGEIALRVMDELTKKHSNIEGVIVSDVPKVFLKKYGNNKNIKFLGLIPQERLFEEVYPAADIFLYPTFSDTLGFAILEAQGFGLPVVAMQTRSTHTVEETLQDGKTGFIVENMKADGLMKIFDDSVVNEFVEKVGRLVEDEKLLAKMGRLAGEEISRGKFSIKERNKKLARIYEEAVK